MSENMTVLPKSDLLTLEEIERLCVAFISRGVDKIRLTGGEPLVRRNIMTLIKSLGSFIKTGMLNELTLTTNGSLLEKYAEQLVESGIRRVNVSLDSLVREKFTKITGIHSLTQMGIKAIGKKDCGCKKRKEALNKAFPYKK